MQYYISAKSHVNPEIRFAIPSFVADSLINVYEVGFNCHPLNHSWWHWNRSKLNSVTNLDHVLVFNATGKRYIINEMK